MSEPTRISLIFNSKRSGRRRRRRRLIWTAKRTLMMMWLVCVKWIKVSLSACLPACLMRRRRGSSSKNIIIPWMHISLFIRYYYTRCWCCCRRNELDCTSVCFLTTRCIIIITTPALLPLPLLKPMGVVSSFFLLSFFLSFFSSSSKVIFKLRQRQAGGRAGGQGE